MLRGNNIANFESTVFAGFPRSASLPADLEPVEDIAEEDMSGGMWTDIDPKAESVQNASIFLLESGFLQHEIVSVQTRVVAGVHIKMQIKMGEDLHETLIYKNPNGDQEIQYSKPL